MKNENLYSIASLLLILISLNSIGQVYVSGALYSDVTWTKANSPYIVDSNIVVFPGNTLTIEPGVEVRFADNTELELRDANIYAVGTVLDSITFTSDSSQPSPASWGRIKVGIGSQDTSKATISYCNFEYGGAQLYGNNATLFTALYLNSSKSATISHSNFRYNGAPGHASGGISSFFKPTIVENCSFYNNEMAICNNSNNVGYFTVISSVFENNSVGCYLFEGGEVENSFFCNNDIGVWDKDGSIVIDCSFSGNEYGIKNYFASIAEIRGCILSNNTIAISGEFGIFQNNYIFQNDIGIELMGSWPASASNNKICINTNYNIKYSPAANTSIPNVCWCTSDSAMIATRIYDGYDDISLGLISFNPFIPCDTSALNVSNNACNPGPVIVSVEPHFIENSINIYPNPFTDKLEVSIGDNAPAVVMIYDITARKILQQEFNGTCSLNTAHLVKGIYIYQVHRHNGKLAQGKVIKQ